MPPAQPTPPAPRHSTAPLPDGVGCADCRQAPSRQPATTLLEATSAIRPKARLGQRYGWCGSSAGIRSAVAGSLASLALVEHRILLLETGQRCAGDVGKPASDLDKFSKSGTQFAPEKRADQRDLCALPRADRRVSSIGHTLYLGNGRLGVAYKVKGRGWSPSMEAAMIAASTTQDPADRVGQSGGLCSRSRVLSHTNACLGRKVEWILGKA